MIRVAPLTVDKIFSRLDVDIESGVCRWVDATKHHRNLIGEIAGGVRGGRSGKAYWVIKLDGTPYKRAQIVLTVSTGVWPNETVDHINGNSLDDRSVNLRHATWTQNAWNHKKRAKRSDLPMGVRVPPNSKGFQARVACNKKTYHLGVYSTPELAHEAYRAKRLELFGEFA
jgi:hypothetical protein